MLFYFTECLRIKDKKGVNEFAIRIEQKKAEAKN